MSMANFCIFVKSGCGLKFGNGDVCGSCGLTVHKSINAYLILSYTCESMNISSSSICSSDLSKLFFI